LRTKISSSKPLLFIRINVIFRISAFIRDLSANGFSRLLPWTLRWALRTPYRTIKSKYEKSIKIIWSHAPALAAAAALSRSFSATASSSRAFCASPRDPRTYNSMRKMSNKKYAEVYFEREFPFFVV
jgi:hypothetical protein